MELLFLAATLHGLHKCRLHTDRTIALADHFLQCFSHALRKFKFVTCAAFDTRQLPKEAEAQQRRIAKNLSRAISSSDGRPQPTEPSLSKSIPSSSKSGKIFYNMDVYKLHSIGDNMASVREFGTLDSYSTQLVSEHVLYIDFIVTCLWQGEGHHRVSKARTGRISWRNIEKELAGIERRESHLRDITASLGRNDVEASPSPTSSRLKDQRQMIVSQLSTAPVSIDDHHYIARSTKTHFYIPLFLRSHSGDPAAVVRCLHHHCTNVNIDTYA